MPSRRRKLILSRRAYLAEKFQSVQYVLPFGLGRRRSTGRRWDSERQSRVALQRARRVLFLALDSVGAPFQSGGCIGWVFGYEDDI